MVISSSRTSGFEQAFLCTNLGAWTFMNFRKRMSFDKFDSLNSSESDNTSVYSLIFEEKSLSNELITTGGWTFFYLGLFYHTATTRVGRWWSRLETLDSTRTKVEKSQIKEKKKWTQNKAIADFSIDMFPVINISGKWFRRIAVITSAPPRVRVLVQAQVETSFFNFFVLIILSISDPL